MLHIAEPLWRKSFRICAPEAQLIRLGVLTASSYHLETISVQYSTVWNSYLGLNGAFEKERIQYRGQDILK